MIRKAPALLLALATVMPLVVRADIRISEVMYDADGTDAKREWIELYNDGPDSVDISKWKFVDTSNHRLNVPPKNGGSGGTVIAAGAFVIVAADATTFSGEYPGIAHVIDTAMSLNNAGATVSVTNGTTVVDTVTYTKSLGASDNGESLQLHAGTWVHAKPTPGRGNATVSSAPVQKKMVAKTPAKKSSAPNVVVAKVAATEMVEDNDPLSVVNATSTDAQLEQVAAVGTLAGSQWWFAAAALALCTGAAATLISRAKKEEWDIEESD